MRGTPCECGEWSQGDGPAAQESADLIIPTSRCPTSWYRVAACGARIVAQCRSGADDGFRQRETAREAFCSELSTLAEPFDNDLLKDNSHACARQNFPRQEKKHCLKRTSPDSGTTKQGQLGISSADLRHAVASNDETVAQDKPRYW